MVSSASCRDSVSAALETLGSQLSVVLRLLTIPRPPPLKPPQEGREPRADGIPSMSDSPELGIRPAARRRPSWRWASSCEVWAGVGVTHRQGPPWAQALIYALAALTLVVRRAAPLPASPAWWACTSSASPWSGRLKAPAWPSRRWWPSTRWPGRRSGAWLDGVSSAWPSWGWHGRRSTRRHDLAQAPAVGPVGAAVGGGLAARCARPDPRPTPSNVSSDRSSGRPGLSPRSATGSPVSSTTSSGTA